MGHSLRPGQLIKPADTSDYEIGSSPYLAANGYRAQGGGNQISSSAAQTTALFTGQASLLTSSASAGLSVHVPDCCFDQDYLLQIFADYSNSGTITVFAGIFAGCAGPGYICGPAPIFRLRIGKTERNKVLIYEKCAKPI